MLLWNEWWKNGLLRFLSMLGWPSVFPQFSNRDKFYQTPVLPFQICFTNYFKAVILTFKALNYVNFTNYNSWKKTWRCAGLHGADSNVLIVEILRKVICEVKGSAFERSDPTQFFHPGSGWARFFQPDVSSMCHPDT